ncbi:hypothetical protein MTR_5g075080 [Medicago truncatula]|uniref:Uncharacterized protein n=1 Tax=Medicago truncatula TaxID=3880 RepID=G7KFN3_MEDTR|nr:hypothetical protein MTR_5g075080 [Medicago truncatula]
MEMYRKISKMLHPNPDTRISIDKIQYCTWFKYEANGRPKKHEEENKTISHVTINDVASIL